MNTLGEEPSGLTVEPVFNDDLDRTVCKLQFNKFSVSHRSWNVRGQGVWDEGVGSILPIHILRNKSGSNFKKFVAFSMTFKCLIDTQPHIHSAFDDKSQTNSFFDIKKSTTDRWLHLEVSTIRKMTDNLNSMQKTNVFDYTFCLTITQTSRSSASSSDGTLRTVPQPFKQPVFMYSVN